METKPVVLHFTGSVGKERKLKQSKKKKEKKKKKEILKKKKKFDFHCFRQQILVQVEPVLCFCL